MGEERGHLDAVARSLHPPLQTRQLSPPGGHLPRQGGKHRGTTCSGFPNTPKPRLLTRSSRDSDQQQAKQELPATGSCPNPAGEEREVWEAWLAAPVH